MRCRMLKTLLIYLIFSLISFPVLADDESPVAELCRTAQKHKADDDVAYKPGVDVSGNPVIPADLNAQPAPIPENIAIPLTVNLAERFHIAIPEGMELKPDVGMIYVYRDGRVIYNDQDLTAQTAVICDDKQDKKPAEAVVPEKKPASGRQQHPQPREEVIWGEGH